MNLAIEARETAKAFENISERDKEKYIEKKQHLITPVLYTVIKEQLTGKDKENQVLTPKQLDIFTEVLSRAKVRLEAAGITVEGGGRHKPRKQKRSTKKRKHLRKRKTSRRS